MTSDAESRSILITGASSGIGRAVATLFLQEGWTVGLLARRAAALQEVATGFDEQRAIVLPADVTKPTEVETAFDTFVKRAGRLDVLFNNAGVFTPPGTIDEIPLGVEPQ